MYSFYGIVRESKHFCIKCQYFASSAKIFFEHFYANILKLYWENVVRILWHMRLVLFAKI